MKVFINNNNTSNNKALWCH